MYIFLDESYNLKDREIPQFISINGFMVLDTKSIFKKWKNCRKPFILNKRRVHASDRSFDGLRAKALTMIEKPELTLLSVFQILQEISFKKDDKYFYKGLNFDKIYFDMLKALFKRLSLGEYRNVEIIIDSRKHRGGILYKELFKNQLINFLQTEYPYTKFNFELQPSCSNILLELADFISNIFYKAYSKNEKEFFDDLTFRII